MNARDLAGTLTTLFQELVDGPPTTGACMLNRGDAGLLRSLDKLHEGIHASRPRE
jgi:hypothetical protein